MERQTAPMENAQTIKAATDGFQFHPIQRQVLTRNDQGEMELILAGIVVRDRRNVGSYSLQTVGTETAADGCTRAVRISPPFSRWKNGCGLNQRAAP